MAGKQDHKQSNEDMVEHIVDLVEERAERIEAEKANEAAANQSAE
jgi:(E)-4-hydroxy-3-methylbut-2-enyl-diphosphate synthase